MRRCSSVPLLSIGASYEHCHFRYFPHHAGIPSGHRKIVHLAGFRRRNIANTVTARAGSPRRMPGLLNVIGSGPANVLMVVIIPIFPWCLSTISRISRRSCTG